MRWQKREIVFRYSALSTVFCPAVAVVCHCGIYYLIFWFVLYRLLRLETDSLLKPVALVLIAFMMLANGLTNYVIFRARNLRLSFVIGSLAPIFDTMLFVLLLVLDRIAALSLIPYLVYRVYGVWWGYAYGKSIVAARRFHSDKTKPIIVSPSRVRFITTPGGWPTLTIGMTRPTS